MIDDLFTELAVAAVDHLLSPQTPREEAAFGLARLNARLSSRLHPEDAQPGREPSAPTESELETRLLNQYLQLAADDLYQISPRVHEWFLERLSNASITSNADTLATLTTLYFLFPESTVRHVVVGLLLQADDRWTSGNEPSRITIIGRAIDRDEGLSPEDRVDQIRLLLDLLLDYLDLFPHVTERALTALYQGHREEILRNHLLAWSTRLGGEPGSRISLAIERTDGRR